MRAVVQRVSSAHVTVDGNVVGAIGIGVMVLLGISKGDTEVDADFLADKIVNMRIFEDNLGKMNRSLSDIGGAMLVVSQFTLLGDCRKGRRPSFSEAAPPEKAEELYDYFVKLSRDKGIRTETGQFRTAMEVSLVNSGPVTLILDTGE